MCSIVAHKPLDKYVHTYDTYILRCLCVCGRLPRPPCRKNPRRRLSLRCKTASCARAQRSKPASMEDRNAYISDIKKKSYASLIYRMCTAHVYVYVVRTGPNPLWWTVPFKGHEWWIVIIIWFYLRKHTRAVWPYADTKTYGFAPRTYRWSWMICCGIYWETGNGCWCSNEDPVLYYQWWYNVYHRFQHRIQCLLGVSIMFHHHSSHMCSCEQLTEYEWLL